MVWSFQVPSFKPSVATLEDCREDSTTVRDTVTAVRLYWAARWSDPVVWTLLRSHPTTAGQPDTFVLDDTPPGGTYEIEAVRWNGMAGCRAARTVGTPTTGVGDSRSTPVVDRWFDVSGRRVRPPLPAGIYWRVRGTKRTRVVVMPPSP